VSHGVASRDEWLDARRALLAGEKELNRRRDELAAERRALPWVRVSTDYRFDTPDGERTLRDLFDGRSQLIVYHFMFGPDWDEGCPSCSFWADTFDGVTVHLAHRDVTLTVVSRAPLAQLEAYRRRMGWRFPWVSSHGSSFNHDFHVSFAPDQQAEGAEYNYRHLEHPMEEHPGLSVFVLEGDDIFHTYSTYERGLDPLNNAYQLLDLVPKGRDEDDLEWPMAWLRRHDAYGAA
jgi:predicted dithiol-disulfide oxidoreductase (DUF899 family)